VAEVVTHPVAGWRVIASPDALDVMLAGPGSTVVRISPDDALVIGPTEPHVLGDEHAIITPEHGFAAAELTADQLTSIAVEHIEWQLPTARPALAQGQIAGVPAKLVLHAGGGATLLVACAARHELEARLNPRPPGGVAP
jgi:hypothetical protein